MFVLKWLRRTKLPIFALIIVAFLVLFLLDLTNRISTLHQLEFQEQTLRSDVANLQSTLDEVDERIAYAESDTAVEEWARQQGLMQREDDHVIIPLPGVTFTPTAVPYVEIEVTEPPNWEIWKALIFD